MLIDNARAELRSHLYKLWGIIESSVSFSSKHLAVINADISRKKALADKRIELNQTISKKDRIFACLKLIARITLTISSTLLIISTVLLLIYKEQCFGFHSLEGDIIWPTIIISIYSLLYSGVMILIYVLYKTYQRNLILASIKK